MPYYTPAQKAHLTRVNKTARLIALRLETAETPLDVFEAFQAMRTLHRVSPAILGDAYYMLDTHPDRYRGRWHGLLRATRNTPDLGEQLFALWA
jgi:hypothetical protein